MKSVKVQDTIDGIADEKDVIEVRLMENVSGQVLYVDVNGVTMLRIGHIKQQVELLDQTHIKIGD